MKTPRQFWLIGALLVVACALVAMSYRDADFVMAWATRLWSCF